MDTPINIPTLDQTVLDSLSFFQNNQPPRFDISKYDLPFVVGSGNALSTGKIMFSKQAFIPADESNFRSVIQSYEKVVQNGFITQAVVISASGEKDSVWETQLAKDHGLHTTLLTCKPQSSAAQIADEVLAFKSIAEPYTYNTSTYLGMILASTGEKPASIHELITNTTLPQGFADYESYAFILPDEYINIAPMIIVKRDELFGPHLMIRACAQGHARHAKFVHPWDKELVISTFDSAMEKNEFFGHPDHRWNIALPIGASFGTVMSLSYYLCGKIQTVKPPYFKQDVEKFCTDYGPKAYGAVQTFEVIVPGNE